MLAYEINDSGNGYYHNELNRLENLPLSFSFPHSFIDWALTEF